MSKIKTHRAAGEIKALRATPITLVTVKPDTISNVDASESEITRKEIYAEIDERPVRFHVDCRATVNVIPKEFNGSRKNAPTDKVFHMRKKSELEQEGTCCMTLPNPTTRRKYSVELMVVPEALTPLPGAKALQHMGPIKVKLDNFKELPVAVSTQAHSRHKDVFLLTMILQRSSNFYIQMLTQCPPPPLPPEYST